VVRFPEFRGLGNAVSEMKPVRRPTGAGYGENLVWEQKKNISLLFTPWMPLSDNEVPSSLRIRVWLIALLLCAILLEHQPTFLATCNETCSYITAHPRHKGVQNKHPFSVCICRLLWCIEQQGDTASVV
jgi:hypothetical protein